MSSPNLGRDDVPRVVPVIGLTNGHVANSTGYVILFQGRNKLQFIFVLRLTHTVCTMSGLWCTQGFALHEQFTSAAYSDNSKSDIQVRD